MKVKLWVETGFVNASHEETIEISEDFDSEQELEEFLEEEAKAFMHQCIDYGYEVFKDD